MRNWISTSSGIKNARLFATMTTIVRVWVVKRAHISSSFVWFAPLFACGSLFRYLAPTPVAITSIAFNPENQFDTDYLRLNSRISTEIKSAEKKICHTKSNKNNARKRFLISKTYVRLSISLVAFLLLPVPILIIEFVFFSLNFSFTICHQRYRCYCCLTFIKEK